MLKETIKAALEEKFGGTVQFETVMKNNQTLTAIMCRQDEKQRVVPSIYLEQLEKIAESEGEEKAISVAIDTYKKGIEEGERLFPENFSLREENLVIMPCVMNRENNEELLKKIPHILIGDDIALYYKLVFDGRENILMSSFITNDLAERLSLSLEEMKEKSLIYSKKQAFAKDVFSLLEEDISGLPEECRGSLIAVTNKAKTMGAGVAFAYPEILKTVCETNGWEEAYVLPSSVHEVLLMDTDREGANFVANMVQEVNLYEVDEEDLLSNSVFVFHPETLSFSLVEKGEPLAETIRRKSA